MSSWIGFLSTDPLYFGSHSLSYSVTTWHISSRIKVLCFLKSKVAHLLKFSVATGWAVMNHAVKSDKIKRILLVLGSPDLFP